MFELSVFLKDRLIGRSTFSEDEVRIGRSADNEVQIDNLALSRYHASIEHTDGAYVIKDWQSQNGTFVNGDRVNGRRALDDGDRVGFGKFILVFRADKQQAAVGEAAKIRDKASYAIAGETIVGYVAPEVKEKPCPHVGHLEHQMNPTAAPTVITLTKDVTVLGSDPGSDILVASVPPRVLAILRGWTGFHAVPLGPGTKHRGNPLESRVALASGDELRLGPNTVYRFQSTKLEVGP